MSRAATGDTVVLKPQNNVYTALAVAGTLACALAILVLFMRAKSLLDPSASLFG